MNKITKINIPTNFTRQSISHFLEQIMNDEKKPICGDIDFNFETLNFILPAGVVVLSNILSWLENRQNISVSFAMPEYSGRYISSQDPIKFLDDCGFFQKHLHTKLFCNSKLRPTTIPMSIIKRETSTQWLEDTFLPWLSYNTLKRDLDGFAVVQVCLMEIINNIKDHSQEEVGCFFGQFFPRTNQIIIAVSDFGIGIPKSMRKAFAGISDPQALKLAAEEGVTSGTTQRNRGAGLNTLITNVVKNWRGEVFIQSDHAKMTCIRKRTGDISYRYSSTNHYYPGTFIELIFKTDYIYDKGDDEEFSW